MTQPCYLGLLIELRGVWTSLKMRVVTGQLSKLCPITAEHSGPKSLGDFGQNTKICEIENSACLTTISIMGVSVQSYHKRSNPLIDYVLSLKREPVIFGKV